MSPETIREAIMETPEYKEWDNWSFGGPDIDEYVEDVLSTVITLKNKLVPTTPEEDSPGGQVKDWRTINLRSIRIVATAWKVVYDEGPLGEPNNGIG